MGKKAEYKQDGKKTSDATTPLDIELDEVEDGYKRTIQHVSLEDEDTGFTEARIGYKNRNDVYHWWVAQETPQAGVLYWMDRAKVLLGGHTLVLRFVGTTNLDVLAYAVDGFTEKVGP